MRTTRPGYASSRVSFAAPPMPPVFSLQYVGQTRLTVVGPVTGAHYSFDRPGAVVEVDSRDRVLLASLRQLKQVP